jgi:hypothetical protein
MFTTPFEIDTELARLHGEAQMASMKVGYALDRVHHLAGDKQETYSRYRLRRWLMTEAECMARINDPDFDAGYNTFSYGDSPQELHESRVWLEAVEAEIYALDCIFAANPWSRFFIVPGGHIHSSMECSTCNNGHEPTRFGWLPQLSGKSEAEAVADQGSLLCTICFPSAPVEWTNFYEEKAAAKKAAQCPGSGTYDYDRETARRYATCNHCGGWASVTTTGKMRAHKPEAK